MDDFEGKAQELSPLLTPMLQEEINTGIILIYIKFLKVPKFFGGS